VGRSQLSARTKPANRLAKPELVQTLKRKNFIPSFAENFVGFGHFLDKVGDKVRDNGLEAGLLANGLTNGRPRFGGKLRLFPK
jgi:hypothetical protein